MLNIEKLVEQIIREISEIEQTNVSFDIAEMTLKSKLFNLRVQYHKLMNLINPDSDYSYDNWSNPNND